MSRIVLTGGTGSLASHILAMRQKGKIFNSSDTVVIASRDEYKQWLMHNRYPDTEFKICDIRDRNRVFEVLKGSDVVIHAAAMKQIDTCEANPWDAIQTNVIGAKNVVDACVHHGIRAVAVGTDKQVNPINLYGMTKGLQEKLFLKAGFNAVRYGNVMGSRGSVLELYQNLRLKGKKEMPVTHIEMTRFFLRLEHAVDIIKKSLETKGDGTIFIPKSPSAAIIDVAELFGRPVFSGIRSGEKLHEILVANEEMMYVREMAEYLKILPHIVDETHYGMYVSNDKENMIEGNDLRKMLHPWLKESI